MARPFANIWITAAYGSAVARRQAAKPADKRRSQRTSGEAGGQATKPPGKR
jgi:hypothetical protein